MGIFGFSEVLGARRSAWPLSVRPRVGEGVTGTGEEALELVSGGGRVGGRLSPVSPERNVQAFGTQLRQHARERGAVLVLS